MTQEIEVKIKAETKTSVKIAVIYHSDGGSTKNVAESIAQGVAGVEGASVDIFTADKAIEKLRQLNDYDGFIFGSATLMGSVSAKLKAFFETTGGIFALRSYQDKLAGGFTNSASISGDKQGALMQIFTFASQHGMLWVPLGLLPLNNRLEFNVNAHDRGGFFSGLATQSVVDADPATQPSEAELRAARFYGARFAKVALQYYK